MNPLKEWTTLFKSKSFAKRSEAVNFLKKEYGVTHGFANTIVSLSKGDNASPTDLVNNQYQEKSLRPIYEKILAILQAFDDDVGVIPKKTAVSIIRKSTHYWLTRINQSDLNRYWNEGMINALQHS